MLTRDFRRVFGLVKGSEGFAVIMLLSNVRQPLSAIIQFHFLCCLNS